jgi:hypothetical protein
VICGSSYASGSDPRERCNHRPERSGYDIGQPQGRCPDLAGPEPQDLVDLARRTRAAHGTSIRLVPTWSGVFGLDMAGDVLLPGPDARIAPTTFDDWLAGETRT